MYLMIFFSVYILVTSITSNIFNAAAAQKRIILAFVYES